MGIMKRLFICIVCLLALCASLEARIKVSNNSGDGFPIATGGVAAQVYVSPQDGRTVKKAADLFADDVERVTCLKPGKTVAEKPIGRYVIVVATLGNNKWVDRLVSKRIIDVSKIRNGWEQYVITTVDRPQKGTDKALVIVGSDKRGAAYGLLSISEAMGVSPFYWWADVPVRHSGEVWLTGNEVSKRPSVKYRGLFINDEDWGLKPWAAKNFEKELGDIGPKTYAKVCELILRLKGNMLGPAMHSCTGAFYSHPESKLVADTFGIFITTSHCEPLLINTASKWEWDIKRDGDWNYKTNKQAIVDKWNRRLDEASRFDNIYTTAMRGLHDAGLRGNLPLDERTKLLSQVISDQRQLLVNHIKKPITEIPQIFVPYKETMDVYENGLKVPEDITLVWVDDNYGYMKRVSNPKEQKRSGGSGVYYHISYWGAPHDYLWLNTTPPVLMYEELMKVYQTGGNRYWLLNVGDIKPGELGLKTFFDLAWDVDNLDISSVNNHQSQFLGSIFGKGYVPRLQHLLDEYYRLAWSRKPEYMGWEREYDKKEKEQLYDTEFSFQNYGEAQRRLADYERIANEARSLMDELPQSFKPSFFEMVAYPVMGASQMNRKFLMAQLNHEQYKAGNTAAANWAARQTNLAFDSLKTLNREYNALLSGKWNYMMNFAVGGNAKYMNKPELNVSEGVEEEPVRLLCLAEEDGTEGHKDPTLHKDLGVYVIDLTKALKNSDGKYSPVKGLGYDWVVMRLDSGSVSYRLPAIDKDSIEVTLYTVPVFPLYKGLGTKVGVSIDGSEPQVFDNKFKEYGESWKDQVLRNGAVAHMKFAIDRTMTSHTLTLICGDKGQMVQKVIVDWGGLKPSYLGPKKS